MGLKELIAASLAFLPHNYTNVPIDRHVIFQEDIEALVEKSKKLWSENQQYRIDQPSSREKAAELYKQIVKLSNDDKHKEVLLRMQDKLARETFKAAQGLHAYELLPPFGMKLLHDAYGIKSAEQASKLSMQMYKDAISHLEAATTAKQDDAELWLYLGTTHCRFKEYDKALPAFRQCVTLKPDDLRSYLSLWGACAGGKQPGRAMEELNKLPGNAEKKIELLAAGMELSYKEARAVNTRLKIEATTREDKLKAADFLYEISKHRWANEMKKEKYLERDWFLAQYECFFAGSFDLLAAENDEQRLKAFKRFDSAFEEINKGLNDGLGKLENVYHFSVNKKKLIGIDEGEKIYEMLKELRKK